ncbi:MAG: hypothetical protein R3D71_09540 [Rickettsiales bacterium]
MDVLTGNNKNAPFLKIPVTPDNIDKVIGAINEARKLGIEYVDEGRDKDSTFRAISSKLLELLPPDATPPVENGKPQQGR